MSTVSGFSARSATTTVGPWTLQVPMTGLITSLLQLHSALWQRLATSCDGGCMDSSAEPVAR